MVGCKGGVFVECKKKEKRGLWCGDCGSVSKQWHG